MEINKVPQDDEGLLDGRGRELQYAVDENGNYVQALSLGWEPKNTTFRQAWSLIKDRMESARQDLLDGKASPVLYYMELHIMDTGLLADSVGLPKRKVKKHLQMKHFKALDESALSAYASAFGISAAELKDESRIINSTPEQDIFNKIGQKI